MYNAEKYVGECLDSILAQTFQNFEVIIVDDCSTDKSVEVVKSYAPRFDGRLNLAKTEKNTGSPGDPANMGLVLSRGEYLSILDNDDAITPTALEELYTVAKNFEADFVTCEKYYKIPDNLWHDAEYRKNVKARSYQSGDFVDEPVLISGNVAQRVKECYDRRFLWNLWSKLIRRDFVLENDIRFTNNVIQDMLATCCMVYAAERYVRVPSVVNYYRGLKDSLSHAQDDPIKRFRRYVRALIVGFNYLDNFLNRRDYFQQNLNMKYIALETYVREAWGYLNRVYSKFNAWELDQYLREEFKNEVNPALMAFIFNLMNTYRLNLTRVYRDKLEQQRIKEFEDEISSIDKKE